MAAESDGVEAAGREVTSSLPSVPLPADVSDVNVSDTVTVRPASNMSWFGDVAVGTDQIDDAESLPQEKESLMNASTVSTGDLNGSPTVDVDWSTFDLEPPFNVFCPDAGNPFDFGAEMGFLNLELNMTSESPSVLFPENEGSSHALSAKDMLVTVSQAFKQSLWRWHPEAQDYLTIEQPNLSLPTFILDWSKTLSVQGPFNLHVKLSTSTRDKILAMVVGACKPRNIPVVLSSFPSAELVETLVRNFFNVHVSQYSTWLHPASFRASEVRVELLAAVIAAGAVATPHRTVQKFGLALQEALRFTLSNTVGIPIERAATQPYLS